MIYKCPCCGHKLYEAPKVDSLLHMKLSKVQSSVLEELVANHPQGVNKDALLNKLYGDQERPRHAKVGLRIQIGRLRKKLADTGWTIPENSPGRANAKNYRLEPEVK